MGIKLHIFIWKLIAIMIDDFFFILDLWIRIFFPSPLSHKVWLRGRVKLPSKEWWRGYVARLQPVSHEGLPSVARNRRAEAGCSSFLFILLFVCDFDSQISIHISIFLLSMTKKIYILNLILYQNIKNKFLKYFFIKCNDI